MRASLRAAAVVALIAGPTALAFFAGGYFDRPRLIAGVAAWGLVVLAALIVPRPLPSTFPGRLALAGLLLLTAWTALSILWAPLGERAQDDVQRLLLYLAYFTAAIAFLRDSPTRSWLEPGLVLGVFVVVAYGLSERLLPGLVELDRSAASAGRLEQPITYWNAFGLLAAVGFVLAARVAGDPDRPRVLRSLAAAAAVPIGLAIYLTFARGALAAAGVGLVLMVALAPRARPALRSALTLLGAGVVAAIVAGALPTVQSVDTNRAGDTSEGLVMLLALVVLSAAAAIAVPRAPRRELPFPRIPTVRARTLLVGAAVALVALGLALAAFDAKPEGISPAPGADPARLSSIDTNRYRYWDVAARSFAAQPVLGLGSGGFFVEWLKERDRVDRSGDAHSLYLETLAELGVVGFAFLLMFVGGIVAAVVRLHRLDAAAATGPGAALVTWAAHAGIDWDWEMPAVTLPALLLGAAAIAWYEEQSAVERSVTASVVDDTTRRTVASYLLGMGRCA